MPYPNLSRVEKLLSTILGFTVNLESPQSRLEEILKSIIDGTTYTKPPLSRIEEDFLKWGAGVGTITDTQSRIEEILKHALAGTDYKGVRLSRIEERRHYFEKYIRKKTESSLPYHEPEIHHGLRDHRDLPDHLHLRSCQLCR